MIEIIGWIALYLVGWLVVWAGAIYAALLYSEWTQPGGGLANLVLPWMAHWAVLIAGAAVGLVLIGAIVF